MSTSYYRKLPKRLKVKVADIKYSENLGYFDRYEVTLKSPYKYHNQSVILCETQSEITEILKEAKNEANSKNT